jgi:hypothetical protein
MLLLKSCSAEGLLRCLAHHTIIACVSLGESASALHLCQ